MSLGSTQQLPAWNPGIAAPEVLPSRIAPRVRSANEVRIARVDTRARPANALAVGNAGGAGAAAAADAVGAKIILRIRGRVIVVDEGEIEWVDGAGNYVRLHVAGAKHQVRGTLKDVEKVLSNAGERFVRVHRSTILNLHSVREFVRTPYGDLIAILRGGQRLAVGRVYRSKIEALLATRL